MIRAPFLLIKGRQQPSRGTCAWLVFALRLPLPEREQASGAPIGYRWLCTFRGVRPQGQTNDRMYK